MILTTIFSTIGALALLWLLIMAILKKLNDDL